MNLYFHILKISYHSVDINEKSAWKLLLFHWELNKLIYIFSLFFLEKLKYFFLDWKWNGKWKIHFLIINSTLYLAIWYLILFFIIIIFVILYILIFELLWIRKILFFASKFLSNILTLNSLVQCELNPMKRVNIFCLFIIFCWFIFKFIILIEKTTINLVTLSSTFN